MKFARWILWEKSHLEKEIGKIRSDLYLHAQRINHTENIGKNIMSELNKLRAAVTANQVAVDAAIARVEACIAAGVTVPPELAITLDASTAKLDALLVDHGASTGGITG